MYKFPTNFNYIYIFLIFSTIKSNMKKKYFLTFLISLVLFKKNENHLNNNENHLNNNENHLLIVFLVLNTFLYIY